MKLLNEKLEKRIQELKDSYFDEYSYYPKEESDNVLRKHLINGTYSKDPVITLEPSGYFNCRWVFTHFTFIWCCKEYTKCLVMNNEFAELEFIEL